MSLLKRIFGQRPPLEQLRQFAAQENWAAVFIAVRKIDRAGLAAPEQEEVAALEEHAGDKLAELNLDEGAGEARIGNLLRARDHFQLACEQARSAALRQRSEAALVKLDRGDLEPDGKSSTRAAAACGSGCSTPRDLKAEAFDGAELDDEVRFEVLLATLPEDLAERYLAAGDTFRRAWLASHEEDPAHALELLELVPAVERDALFYCERGNLKARNRDLPGALTDLHKAMVDDPYLFVALSTTVDLLVGSGHLDTAEQLLRKGLAEERFQTYCQANLAQVMAHRGDEGAALEFAGQALAAGSADPPTVQLCAKILEQRERFAEAEAMLGRLPASGCGGGAHPLLAEFWLRRNKNLDQALEIFKGTLRQDPDNPRWLLRIAQTDLARGWKNEAAEQLDRLLAHVGLTDELRIEVQTTAEQLRQVWSRPGR